MTQRALVLATPEGEIQFVDPVARGWLKEFFGRPTRAGLLPRKICRWLAGDKQKQRPGSFVAKQEDARLYLKKEKDYIHHSIVLLLELIKGKNEERARRHRHLTRREHEVLWWVAHGKSNADVAEILGIEVATVSKHLERIYPKLGVENRTAAIAVASDSNGKTH